MIDYLGKLYSFFDRRTRFRFVKLFAIMLVGAALDTLGISLVFPLLQLAIEPGGPAAMPILAPAFSLLGLDGPGEILVACGVAILAIYAVKNASLFVVVYLQNDFVFKQQALFATSLFSHYMKRSYPKHLEQNSAEIMRNIMITSRQVFSNGVMGSLTLALEGMMIVGATVVLFVVEPVGAMLASALIAVVMGTLYLATRIRLVTWGGELEWRRARMIQKINEGLAAFKEIKVLGREQFFIDEFSVPNLDSAPYRTKVTMVAVLPSMVGEIALIGSIFVVNVAMVLFGGRTMADALPVLGLFAAAVLRIMPSANRIVMVANNIRASIVPLENLYRDCHAWRAGSEPAQPRAAITFEDSIALGDVSFQFNTAQTPSVRGVSLTIRKGESIAFVGATGAGKSTLADLILALLEPDAGEVAVDGVDVRRATSHWQSRIGYVPQEIVLSDDTLRRNIAFGLADDAIDEDRVWEVARIAQIEPLIQGLANGLDTMSGEHGLHLSGGERQRIGIARALYHDPDVLVLDEATSSLDTVTEGKFVQAIEALRGDKTLIIIAHRLSTVRACDRIFFLADGRVVDSGGYDELQARNPDFHRLTLPDSDNPAN